MKILFIISLLFLFSENLSASLLHFNNRIYTPYLGTAVIKTFPEASTLVEVNPRTGNFLDQNVRNRITFGVDEFYQGYFGSYMNVSIQASVKRWDQNLIAIADTTITLNIVYNPFIAGDYIDMQSANFHGAYKILLTLDQITVNGVDQETLPSNLFLDAEIFVERYEKFQTHSTPINFLTSLSSEIDLDCDGIIDTKRILWETVPGVEEYQLEWAHVNDYDYTENSELPAEALTFNFKFNSTRISTTDTYYDLSLIFDRGYLVYRIRGIGVDIDDLDQYIFGDWNLPESGIVSNLNNDFSYYIDESKIHETDLNWQYSVTYAEEGKKKEIISYYDGSLRGRQTVTKINSDKNTIVGETIYDHQGRAAINVLPSPVSNPVCSPNAQSSIKFYPNFSRNLDAEGYSKKDFDKSPEGDNCDLSAQGMHSSYGASNYYSPLNPNQQYQQAYVPNAELYPFTQVEYTPDNTGRIRRQGGVGEEFQLGTGHESKYFYGQPNQLELDRTFGSEVGDATHYKKNVVIDANGQASVSYLDQEGRVVMTNLAGDSPENLIALESSINAVQHLTVNAFGDNDNMNEVDIDGESIVFSSQLLVAYNSLYTFDYDFNIAPLQDPCLANICIDCVYDLTIELIDECGMQLIDPTITNKLVGKFTDNSGTGGGFTFHAVCQNELNGSDAEHFELELIPGNYSLNKRLTINNDARQAFIDLYFNESLNTCVKSLEDFVAEEMAKVDTSDCKITCENCLTNLGSLEDYIANGEGTEQDYYLRKKDCDLLCDEGKTLCEIQYDAMLADMAPGGQYAEYVDPIDGSFHPGIFGLSILSESNNLPSRFNSQEPGFNWRFPKIKDDLGEHLEYRDENGERSRILVFEDAFGNWSPAIVNNNPVFVFTDVLTGENYTYPEFLANGKDFADRFEPSWAKSLVYYHPEYCYYETCSSYKDKVLETDNFTSESFELLLKKTNTYQEALDSKFIISNTINWFAPSSDPSKPYDPFVYNNSFYNQSSASCVDFGLSLQNKFAIYQIVDGTPRTMLEMAMYITTNSLHSQDPNIAVSFNFLTIGNVEEHKNLLWQNLKALYLSERQSLMNKRADCLALNSCNSFNDCIGQENPNPWTEGMLSTFQYSGSFPSNPYFSLPLFSLLQPCSSSTKDYYKNKIARFGSEIQNQASVEDVTYQIFQETGKCPQNYSFQNFLSTLASNQKLNDEGVLLNDYSAFTNLAIAENNMSMPTSIPSVTYNMLVDGNNPNKLIGTWNTGNDVYANFMLKKEEIPVVEWDSIKQIVCLECGIDNTFTAKGIYYDENNDIHTIDLAGSIDKYELCNNVCEFPPVCKANDLSSDLTTVFNVLNHIGVIANNEVNLSNFNPSANLSPGQGGNLDFPTIRGAVGSFVNSQDIFWSQTTYGFKIESQQDINFNTEELQIQYTYFEPSTFDITQFNQITYFENFMPENGTDFVQIAHLTDNSTVTIHGKLLKLEKTYPTNAIKTYTIEVGSCAMRPKAACTSPEHQNYEQMKRFIKELLLNENYATSNFNNSDLIVENMVEFTDGVQNAFPYNEPIVTKYSYQENQTYQTYYNYLQMYPDMNHDGLLTRDSECSIEIYNNGDFYPKKLPFSALTNIDEFFLYKSDDLMDLHQSVSFTGTFVIDGQTYKNKIYMTSSCINMNSCEGISFDNSISESITGIGLGTSPTDGNDVPTNPIDLPGTGVTLCPPSDDPNSPSNLCKPNYLQYINCQTEFNLWATNNDYPYQITTTVAFDLFVSKYCECYESFCELLTNIKTGQVPLYETQEAFDHFTDLNVVCGIVTGGGSGEPNPCIIPTISPKVAIVNDCIEMEINQALFTAQLRYEEYVNSLTNELINRYNAHCLSVDENFKYTYDDKMYHYTLYYYDQAGNLIRTVPPAGVELLPITSSYDALEVQITSDRSNGEKSVFTNHRLVTRYEYNSLNQLIGQLTPDTDPMDIFEISLPNGLNAKLKTTQIQMVTETRGYLSGYVTVGSINRGYLYQTNDGGNSWTRVNNLLGVDLKKVQMLNNTLGYAAGKAGIILKTIDGGTTWDMMDTWSVTGTGMIKDINDFLFIPTGANFKGIFVGENGLAAETNSNQSTFTLIQNGLPSNASITSITADATNFFITVNETLAGEVQGSVYYRARNASSGSSWIAEANYATLSLNDIQYVENNIAYAVGNDGRLFKNLNATLTTATAPKWTLVPTDVSYDIKAISFFNQNQGVALMETAPNTNSLMRTADGGKTWVMVSSSNFNSLNKSADNTLILAVGANASIEIAVPMDNGPYDNNIKVSFLNETANITAGWLDRTILPNGLSKVALIVADASGNLQATADAFQDIPVWITTNLAADLAGASVKNMQAKTISNGSAIGALVSSTNKLILFERNNLQHITTNIPNSIPSSGIYATLALDNIRIYSVNNANNTIAIINLNNTLAATTFVQTGQTISGNPLLTRLVSRNNILLGINNTGFIGVVNFNAGTNLITSQANRRNWFKANALKDIEFANSTYLMAGIDGQLFKRSTASGTPWELLQTKTNEDINALKTIGSDVYMVGSDALVKRGTLTTNTYNGVLCNLTNNLTIESQLETDFFDIQAKNNRIYVVGEAGKVLYLANLGLSNRFENLNHGNQNLYGINFKTTTDQAFVVGDVASFVEVSAQSFMVKKDLFVTALKDVHFMDLNNGTILGNKFVIRVTHDGGNSWQFVRPTTDFIPASASAQNRIWTYAPNLSMLFGSAQFAIHNGIATQQSISGITSTMEVTAVAQGENAAFLHLGIKVSSISQKVFQLNITATNTPLPYSFASSTLTNSVSNIATSRINTIHVFDNNEFAIAGQSGMFNYYEPGNPNPRISKTIDVSMTITDMDFYDKTHATFVGLLGKYYKIRTESHNPQGYLTNIITFEAKPQVYTQDAYQPNLVQFMDILAVAYSDKNNLLIGGNYNSSIYNNATYCYVRGVYDPIAKYSSRFYYDRLGRLVVSQNSRQYNLGLVVGGQKKYSYTLYDELGRIVEAGEKTENILASDVKFKQIFGTLVMDYYNPKTMDDARLVQWINGAGVRKEVTHSYYDVTQINNLPVDFVINANTQRKRITHVTYEETYDNNIQTYDHGTHYSYDIHGNVKSLLQDNKKMAETFPTLAQQEFKRLDYKYDLVSGNVHRVSVQNGQRDQWHHAYHYDADNRITAVYTSKETPLLSMKASTAAMNAELLVNANWEKDASYFYYAHGPLARTELGENNLQGMDYVYNLQGWLKGVNSTTLNENRDPGMDGVGLGINYPFAKDVYGYSLHYFEGDYEAINGIGQNHAATINPTSHAAQKSSDLFNGNIRYMQTSITNPSTRAKMSMLNAYRYDQLQRLKESRSYESGLSADEWNPVSYGNEYYNAFSFDANGNILTQKRHKQNGTQIEDMSYRYKTDANGQPLRNRLYHVDDAIAQGVDATDIDDQGTFNSNPNMIETANNSIRDEEGRLIKNIQEEISEIVWTESGKVKEIKRPLLSAKKRVTFDYDAMGIQIAKHVYNNLTGMLEKSTYYVLDAQGNQMSVYEHAVAVLGNASYKLTERQIYGSSHLGIENSEVDMLANVAVSYQQTHLLGKKSYQMSDHRGNVNTVISDMKIPQTIDNITVSAYEVEILNSQDYSPFNVELDGRTFKNSSFRYSVQNQEHHDEILGEGNYINYKYRGYDPRLGRLDWAIDPLANAFPWNSPYAFSENSVIDGIELEGLQDAPINRPGNNPRVGTSPSNAPQTTTWIGTATNARASSNNLRGNTSRYKPEIEITKDEHIAEKLSEVYSKMEDLKAELDIKYINEIKRLKGSVSVLTENYNDVGRANGYVSQVTLVFEINKDRENFEAAEKKYWNDFYTMYNKSLSQQGYAGGECVPCQKEFKDVYKDKTKKEAPDDVKNKTRISLSIILGPSPMEKLKAKILANPSEVNTKQKHITTIGTQ